MLWSTLNYECVTAQPRNIGLDVFTLMAVGISAAIEISRWRERFADPWLLVDCANVFKTTKELRSIQGTQNIPSANVNRKDISHFKALMKVYTSLLF